MVYSAEIRWFFDNREKVAVIERWFNAHQQFFADKWERADVYLWQPDLNNHSVKIREGKVEVKVLLADRGVVQVGTGNSGNANDWMKYSFVLKEKNEENEALLRQFNQSTTKSKEKFWLRVDKERLLIKFSLEPLQNKITEVPRDNWPEEGCGIELTKIQVNQQAYYTFGLEAFSKTKNERQNLDLVLYHIVPDMKIPNLKYRVSHSYPSFLASLYPN